MCVRVVEEPLVGRPSLYAFTSASYQHMSSVNFPVDSDGFECSSNLSWRWRVPERLLSYLELSVKDTRMHCVLLMIINRTIDEWRLEGQFAVGIITLRGLNLEYIIPRSGSSRKALICMQFKYYNYYLC